MWQRIKDAYVRSFKLSILFNCVYSQMEHANDTFKIVSIRQWRMNIVQSCYSSIQIVNFFDYWNIRINRGMIRYKATTKQTISEDTETFLHDVKQAIIGNSVDTHWRCSSSIKEIPQSNFIDWIIITSKKILIRGHRQLRSSYKLLLQIIVSSTIQDGIAE